MSDAVRLEVLMVGLDLAPPEQPAWTRDAACKEHPELRWVAPFRSRRQIEAAKDVCRGCLCRADCLTYALAIEAIGIWGGTSTAERQQMQRTLSCICCLQRPRHTDGLCKVCCRAFARWRIKTGSDDRDAFVDQRKQRLVGVDTGHRVA